jgi:hypothetical protein
MILRSPRLELTASGNFLSHIDDPRFESARVTMHCDLRQTLPLLPIPWPLPALHPDQQSSLSVVQSKTLRFPPGLVAAITSIVSALV